MKMKAKTEATSAKMRRCAYKTVGPVMLSYVEWIIEQAQKRELERIYFLARDGYLLCEIARRVCKARGVAIECRYLYCSRQSLRTPSYCVIGDEAFDLLLLGGYYVTPMTLLKRAMLDGEEIDGILSELHVTDGDKPFSDKELLEFRQALKECDAYKSAVMRRSRAAYGTAIEYFRQEGLFDTDRIAIADSGWTGSMQRSMRQLLQSAGYVGKFIGFYFGMYAEPKDAADGEYLTFYFDASSGTKRKINFCNNLFECMLSAPHSMTVGYCERNGKILPVPSDAKIGDLQAELIAAQLAGALDFADEKLSDGSSFDCKRALKATYKVLKSAMVYPTRELAELYGSFVFCDDVTEAYHMSLANSENLRLLKNYMLLPRIFRKLFKIKKSNAGELFWPFGVIAFCPAPLRPWYRLNVKGWELLKSLLPKH